jgi:hypothetical protein
VPTARIATRYRALKFVDPGLEKVDGDEQRFHRLPGVPAAGRDGLVSGGLQVVDNGRGGRGGGGQHYETALVDLINSKRSGKSITPKERPRGENVVDLMEALRRSVGGAAAESKASKKPTKKPRKAAAGQKEMLMPIEGKKPKEAAGKKPAVRPQRKSA